VFEEEPVDLENPLFSLDNVVVCPHLAGSTRNARKRLVIMAVENLVKALKGEIPARENIINPEVLNR
jgi:phosphoglycerate dehydrogenase-like enzyme